VSAGAGAILQALRNHARLTGKFERARLGEYKAAPGTKLSFAVWSQFLGSSPVGSGLSDTAGLVHAFARIYMPITHKPEDDVELLPAEAADLYLERLNADFTLGGLVRNVDLLGETGTPLLWEFGHINIDNQIYRVADLPIRCVVNDAWPQSE